MPTRKPTGIPYRVKPLLPRYKVGAVIVAYEVPFDYRRLIRLFRKTWSQIPLRYRKQILRLWLELPPLPNTSIPTVPVEFCDWKSDFDGGNSPGGNADKLGNASTGSGFVTFCGPLLEVLRNERVIHTIAHELAHVYTFATDPDLVAEALEWQAREGNTALAYAFHPLEIEAHELTDCWGIEDPEPTPEEDAALDQTAERLRAAFPRNPNDADVLQRLIEARHANP